MGLWQVLMFFSKRWPSNHKNYIWTEGKWQKSGIFMSSWYYWPWSLTFYMIVQLGLTVETIHFHTLSGELTAKRQGEGFCFSQNLFLLWPQSLQNWNRWWDWAGLTIISRRCFRQLWCKFQFWRKNKALLENWEEGSRNIIPRFQELAKAAAASLPIKEVIQDLNLILLWKCFKSK